MTKKYKLTKKFIDEMQEMLMVQEAKLKAELGQFAKTNKHNSDDFETTFPNFGDKEDENSSEVATFSDNISLERSLEKSLRDVRSALKRLKDNSYGVCKYCEEVINPERLKARSASSSCMSCKTRLKGG